MLLEEDGNLLSIFAPRNTDDELGVGHNSLAKQESITRLSNLTTPAHDHSFALREAIKIFSQTNELANLCI